jgi:hypothetical protein
MVRFWTFEMLCHFLLGRGRWMLLKKLVGRGRGLSVVAGVYLVWVSVNKN